MESHSELTGRLKVSITRAATDTRALARWRARLLRLVVRQFHKSIAAAALARLKKPLLFGTTPAAAFCSLSFRFPISSCTQYEHKRRRKHQRSQPQQSPQPCFSQRHKAVIGRLG